MIKFRLMLKEIWAGLIGLLLGLRVTGKILFEVVRGGRQTVCYPEERLDYSSFHGYVKMLFDEQNQSKCVACMACVKACPCGCIEIVSEKKAGGGRKLLDYRFDYTKCCFCGFCVSACRFEALEMNNCFEQAFFQTENMRVNQVKEGERQADLHELSLVEIGEMSKKMKRLF
jgi:NADH-quinone oxidoreductase subunit I